MSKTSWATTSAHAGGGIVYLYLDSDSTAFGTEHL
jgi:hypothetical protein